MLFLVWMVVYLVWKDRMCKTSILLQFICENKTSTINTMCGYCQRLYSLKIECKLRHDIKHIYGNQPLIDKNKNQLCNNIKQSMFQKQLQMLQISEILYLYT